MPKPPPWLESLVDTVAGCMETHSEMGPLMFRWCNEEEHWEVMVYPAPGEVVGGADDGALVSPGFSLDVQGVSSAFEELVDVRTGAGRLSPSGRMIETGSTFPSKACMVATRCRCRCSAKRPRMRNRGSRCT